MTRDALADGITDLPTRDGVHASSLRPDLWRRVTEQAAAREDNWSCEDKSVQEVVDELIGFIADEALCTERICVRVCQAVDTLGATVVNRMGSGRRTIGPGPHRRWTVLTAAAAAAGRCSLCRVCVEVGADVEAPDEEGRTPLHAACEENRRTVALMLLGCGANPRTTTGNIFLRFFGLGTTPAYRARSLGAPDRELGDAMAVATRDPRAAIARLRGMDADGPT